MINLFCVHNKANKTSNESTLSITNYATANSPDEFLNGNIIDAGYIRNITPGNYITRFDTGLKLNLNYVLNSSNAGSTSGQYINTYGII